MRDGFLGALLVTLVIAFSEPALAQSCTWGSSVEAPPSAVSLRSYRDFFHAPGRLAVDSSGKLYATDPGAGLVSIRDPYGRLLSVMEGFSAPLGIAVDGEGRIYVGEQGKGSVSVFDQQWNLLSVFGQGDGEFLIPNDIAIDPQSGWIYVSDSGANTIKVYFSNGTLLSSFGGKGTEAGQFNFPAGIYMSPVGELFVADQNNDRIQVLDRNGNFLRCIGGSAFTFSSKFGRILGLTGDSWGRLYVADAFQGYVQVFDRFGYKLSTIGTFGNGPGQLRTPMGLAIDIHNRLFVASVNTGRVEFFGLDSFSDPHVIPAVVDIQPDSLNRYAVNSYTSPGAITAYIEIRGQSVNQIDRTSITANGVPALLSAVSIGDYNGNGIPDLMVTFDARSLVAPLPDGDPIVIVSGKLHNGERFEGSDGLHLFSEPLPAVVDIQPGTLNRSSHREFITVYIEIANYPLDQVDPATITANGVPANRWPTEIGDYDADGIPDLMVKFDAQPIMAPFPDGDATIIVSGNFRDGTRFEGSRSVRVISSEGRK